MKNILISILAVLTLAGSAQAESLFTVANKGGWYWIDVIAYKTGNHIASEGFDTFDVYLGQEITFSSKDYVRFDVRAEVNVYGGPPNNPVGFRTDKNTHIVLHAYGTSGSPQFYWSETER